MRRYSFMQWRLVDIFVGGAYQREALISSHLCDAGGCLRGDVPPSEVEDFWNLHHQNTRFPASFLYILLNLHAIKINQI